MLRVVVVTCTGCRRAGWRVAGWGGGSQSSLQVMLFGKMESREVGEAWPHL